METGDTVEPGVESLQDTLDAARDLLRKRTPGGRYADRGNRIACHIDAMDEILEWSEEAAEIKASIRGAAYGIGRRAPIRKKERNGCDKGK